jgi:hypothetical protein
MSYKTIKYPTQQGQILHTSVFYENREEKWLRDETQSGCRVQNALFRWYEKL